MWDYVVALTVPPGGGAAAKPSRRRRRRRRRKPPAAAAASGEPLALSIMAGGAESVLIAIRAA